MSGTWEMKRKILKLLEGGKKMPSEISTALGISPSTVTQHLQELKKVGAIKEVNDPFVRKWKYFELNPEFNAKAVESGIMRKNKLPYVAALVVALLVIGAVVSIAVQSLHAPAVPGGILSAVPIRLTDPPTVPNGTTALIIGYSSLQVHTQGQDNTTGWTSATGNGTINLMTVVNESQVIGSVKLSQNASVDMIRFNVTSASIVINGTAYNVTVPSGRVTARITGQGAVNSSASLLLDLSPVVATIYTNTSTVFVLVPSVRAVVVGSANASVSIGSRTALSSKDKTELESARPNITISAVSLSQSGNATQFSVTVRNNGNRSVQLSHILVYGNEIITVHPVPLPAASENSSINVTGRVNQTGNESENSHASVSACPAFYWYNSTAKQCQPQTISPACPPNYPGSPTYFTCSGTKVPSNICPDNYTFNSAESQCIINPGATTSLPSNSNGAARGTANASIGINASARANLTAQDRPGYAGAGSNLSATEGGGVVGEGASNLSIGANSSANLTGGANAHGPEHESEAINIEVNGTRFGTNSSVGATLLKQNGVQDLVNVGEDINSLRVINFQIAQNAQLVLPFSNPCTVVPVHPAGAGMPCIISGPEIPASVSTGYNLTAGSTATFTFSGTISLAFGHITVSQVPGDTYRIVVSGEEGASASGNTIATS